MKNSLLHISSRREFLRRTSAFSVASLFGASTSAFAAPPPETTRIRLVAAPTICLAPQYLADEFLRLEGFSQIEYVRMPDEDFDPHVSVADGRADMTMDAATALVPALDRARPIVVLAGVHGGCWELFGNERVRAVRDLKGKRVAIYGSGSADHIYIASMLAYVGVDPRKDVKWVENMATEGPMQLFTDGNVDAFIAFPPQAQLMRARKVGHVIVNTSQDRPWSQHFCCMIAAHQEFVRKNPIATKCVVRAILKATDVCIREPQMVARFLVAKGYEANYDIALEVVTDVSFSAWRTFNPDDTLRFYALRLHDVGMVKSSPQTLLARGTDWRILNELKRELKA